MNIVSMRRRIDGKIFNGFVFQKCGDNLLFKYYDADEKEWNFNYIEAFEPIV